LVPFLTTIILLLLIAVAFCLAKIYTLRHASQALEASRTRLENGIGSLLKIVQSELAKTQVDPSRQPQVLARLLEFCTTFFRARGAVVYTPIAGKGAMRVLAAAGACRNWLPAEAPAESSAADGNAEAPGGRSKNTAAT